MRARAADAPVQQQASELRFVARTSGMRHEQIMRCHSEAVAWAEAALRSNA
jgi:hypothetical protein